MLLDVNEDTAPGTTPDTSIVKLLFVPVIEILAPAVKLITPVFVNVLPFNDNPVPGKYAPAPEN